MICQFQCNGIMFSLLGISKSKTKKPTVSPQLPPNCNLNEKRASKKPNKFISSVKKCVSLSVIPNNDLTMVLNIFQRKISHLVLKKKKNIQLSLERFLNVQLLNVLKDYQEQPERERPCHTTKMPELKRFGYSLKSRYPLLKFTFYKPWFPCANHTCDWLICNHVIPRGLQLLSAINVQLLFMIRTWLKPVV